MPIRMRLFIGDPIIPGSRSCTDIAVLYIVKDARRIADLWIAVTTAARISHV